MSFSPDPAWIALFPSSDIPIILRDVRDAAKTLAPPPGREKRGEDFLTRKIWNTLRQKQRYYTGPLCPSIEHWTSDASRSDLLFTCGKGLETYFAIEAKRLFVRYPSGGKASLVSEYIAEGMMRFISSKYAPYQEAGAMLGYVFTCSERDARNAVKKAVEIRKGDLLLIGEFSESSLALDPPVDETVHRLNEKNLILYHLFVEIKDR